MLRVAALLAHGSVRENRLGDFFFFPPHVFLLLRLYKSHFSLNP